MEQTFTYDNANRLTVAQDTFSKYTLSYDNANRLTNVDNLGTPNAPRFSLTYTLDGFGNRTNVADNRGGGASYNYDLDNHLTFAKMTTGNGAKVTLTYDSRNRLSTIVRGQVSQSTATITTTFGYDNADRLTGITHTSSSAGSLAVLTYGYDAANQLTSYNGPEGNLTYTYDVDGQLTNVGGARTETYTYDKEGNRTMSGYTTGTGNRLTADGTYTYSYDNEGNMVGRTKTSNGEVTTFTWDFRNRLTEVLIKSSGGTTLQDDKFTYDIENRRIGKNTVSGGQSWTGYDGPNAYADFNSSGSLTNRYLFAPNVADFVLARLLTTNPSWYLTDKLGSVRLFVSTSGSILDQVSYDSYGNIVSETNPSNGDRFKFTGREWDSEIGQYFYRARNYSPTIGRFESEDPIGFQGKDSDLYRYASNSPTNRVDPTGTDDEDIDWVLNPWVKVGTYWKDVGVVVETKWFEEVGSRQPEVVGNQVYVWVTFEKRQIIGTLQVQMAKYERFEPRALFSAKAEMRGLLKGAGAARSEALALAKRANQLNTSIWIIPPVHPQMALFAGAKGALAFFLLAASRHWTVVADDMEARAEILRKQIASGNLPKEKREWLTGNRHVKWGQPFDTGGRERIRFLVPKKANWQDYDVTAPEGGLEGPFWGPP